MIEQFQALGENIARQWAQANREENAFPQIATNMLLHSDVLTSVEPGQIIDWLVKFPEIPEQYLADFGQPPINVYVGEGFYIQVLFWMDSTTAIHGHAFHGAFGVLSGSSVHSRYSFELAESIAPSLLLGRVQFMYSEILQRGCVRAIESGDRFVHALFHLESPSVSVVIRTPARRGAAFSYIKPHLAWDPFQVTSAERTRLRMLESLSLGNPSEFWKYCESLVRNCETPMLYPLLQKAYSIPAAPDTWQELLGAARTRHPAIAIDSILVSIYDEHRANQLLALRSAVRDPAHRFFLALLLNVPSRDQIFHLIQKRFPHSDPETLILEWLSELSNQNLLRPKLEAVSLEFVRLAMRHTTFDMALQTLSSGKEGPWIAARGELSQMWETIRSIDYLKPLFFTHSP